MANKGIVFERKFCKDLSLWWTQGVRDDVFWRTAGSGSRATQRHIHGKQTHGAHGDVCAVDPIGGQLTELFTIELKRGKHSGATIQDLIDKLPSSDRLRMPVLEGYIEKAKRSAVVAGTPTWMLVLRRDRRDAVLIFPKTNILRPIRTRLYSLSMTWVRLRYRRHRTDIFTDVMVVPWMTWIYLHPSHIALCLTGRDGE